MAMEDAEIIAERQDKANHMQFGHVDETFNDLDAKYEETYQEFKKIWIDNPSMSKKEAFKEIGRTYNPDGFLAKHVNQRLVEDGLPLTHKKEINFEVVESSTKEDFEGLYQQFKEIWLANPKISKVRAFKELGENQTNSRMKYINERMKEDGLPQHYEHRGWKGKERKSRIGIFIDESEYESKYQEYKDLFENSDLPIKEIYKKLGILENGNGCYAYIRDRCKEEGLNGYKRSALKRKEHPLYKEKTPKTVKKTEEPQKKRGRGRPKKTESKPKPKTPKKPACKPVTTDVINQRLENSYELLNKFYNERNIKSSTQKGYIASITRWFKYTDGKYNSLQENIDFYMKEEDEKIPMRNRSIKKEMLGFREWLIEDKGIKSDRSVRSYFSKLGTVFRHYGLEIPQLPQVKMEKGYVSSYNDLPTHAMIKTACEQSPLDLKALILFMSSSGSAKAETLSITVEMFLTGCNEYLEEPADATNIQDTLKALSDKHDIVPLIYLRRIKTDKWYFTCCSPEASYMIIESLKTRKNLEWTDKLFDYTGSLILTKFQEINDNNNWGHVGAYRRFRSHALRKFMASNIGLPRDQVDSFQGRAKDMIQEAYFKQDPQNLKKIYMEAMHRVMIYENWGHGTTPSEIEQRAKRLKNGFNDNEKILDLSIIPETPEEIKSSVGLGNDAETTVASDKNTRNVQHNSANTMPVTAPVQMPTGMIQGISISKELLQYAELMEKGLLSIGEFNRIKQTLLMSVIR